MAHMKSLCKVCPTKQKQPKIRKIAPPCRQGLFLMADRNPKYLTTYHPIRELEKVSNHSFCVLLYALVLHLFLSTVLSFRHLWLNFIALASALHSQQTIVFSQHLRDIWGGLHVDMSAHFHRREHSKDPK